MKLYGVIKKSIQTEKTYKAMEGGVYTFLVDDRSTKSEIKRFVEAQFGVEVKGVNVASVAPKRKRIAKSRKTVIVGGGKKAIVWLKPGNSIPALLPKSESKPKSKEKKSENDGKKGILGKIKERSK